MYVQIFLLSVHLNVENSDGRRGPRQTWALDTLKTQATGLVRKVFVVCVDFCVCS